jgi:hypothetical protein
MVGNGRLVKSTDPLWTSLVVPCRMEVRGVCHRESLGRTAPGRPLLAALACLVCIPTYCVGSNNRRVEITVVACKPATYDPGAQAVYKHSCLPERLPSALGEV